ncbi:MAG: hypothetical protein NTU44_15585, partial [Bacteroidetes bacterium]|nr:hypothetical protein [Bacteroidota bacterium]
MRNNVLLPKKLTEAILSTGLTGKGLKKGIAFIEYLFYKMSDEEEMEKTCFVNIPSLTIKSLIDRNYTSLFMAILVKNKIIIRRPFKHRDEKDNMCFGYRIDDSLLDYNDIGSLDLPPVKPSKKPVDELSYVVDDLKKIQFDIPGMIKLVQDLDVWSLVKLNSQIKEDPLELTPIFSKVKFKSNKSLEDALALSKRIRKDLVQYDNRFFITYAQKFCMWKEITLKSSMLYAISKLNNSDFYASRNETNYRLDTNLTNLKGDFFTAGLLSLDGERIVDIDLKNSQPSLLSFVLAGGIFSNEHLQPILAEYTFPKIDKTQIDYQLFIQLAESGLLYDQISTMTGWK